MNVDIAIVGGGISGLATAYHLKQAGHSVCVLERQARTGGNAVSENINGFLMEHGPSTVAGNSTDAMALSTAFGLDGERCNLGGDIACRYMVKNGALHRIPIGPMGFLTSDYLSTAARLRMMAELFVPRRTKPDGRRESVQQFCQRRFGVGFADRVMDPLVRGIYAGRAEDLSVNDIFPKLVELERRYGSVTRGMIASMGKGARMPGSRLMSWRHGIASLPKALTKNLGDDVQTGVAVRAIRHTGHGYVLDLGHAGRISAGHVVLAAQPHVAAGLLEKLDPDGADAASAITAPPLAVVFFGFQRAQVEHRLDSLGFLAASTEEDALNGVQFCSTMFPGRAPGGHVAVAAYVGGARNPDLATRPTAELIDLVGNKLKNLIGMGGKPVVVRVRHWPRGIPQYTLGHQARKQTLLGLPKRLPGLYVTGNFMEGPSVSACLSSAARVSQEIQEAYDRNLKHLRQGNITFANSHCISS